MMATSTSVGAVMLSGAISGAAYISAICTIPRTKIVPAIILSITMLQIVGLDSAEPDDGGQSRPADAEQHSRHRSVGCGIADSYR